MTVVEQDEVAAAQHRTNLAVERFCLLGGPMCVALLLLPFSAAISAQLRRIEGRRGILSTVQMCAV